MPQPLPLRIAVRPGVRFTCHADGLCCSDIHVLGPLSDEELIPLRALGRKIVGRDASVGGWAFRVEQRGACSFLVEDNRCRVHATLGAELKPATCRRFPFYFVETPLGLRAATSHRCTCRTLGERALIDEAAVFAEVGTPQAPLTTAWKVGASVVVEGQDSVPFLVWTQIEERLIARLLRTRDSRSVLDAPGFSVLRQGTWAAVAERFGRPIDASGFEQAKAWIGDAIFAVEEGRPYLDRPRPWQRFLPNLTSRIKETDAPAAMLADWMADEIWCLEWTRRGSFLQARLDFATRLRIVTALADEFLRLGTPPILATAEAIMVMDAVGHSPHWDQVARGFQRKLP